MVVSIRVPTDTRRGCHTTRSCPTRRPSPTLSNSNAPPVTPPADEEAAVEDPAAPPLETPEADWREQLDAVELDPDDAPVDE